MKRTIYFAASLLMLGNFTSCEIYESPERSDTGEKEVTYYEDLYDPICDNGQYWVPDWTPTCEQDTPMRYFNVRFLAGQGNRNSLAESDPNVGLQAFLLAQSVAGLVNSNIDRTYNTAVWLCDESSPQLESYKASLKYLNNSGMYEFGSCVAKQLTEYGELQQVINKYILVDVVNNPESQVYATVASPHLGAYIVDVRDRNIVNPAHVMILDAREKTTRDAWDEYKDKVNKNGLVILPVGVGELTDFAIKNKFFRINLNKEYGNPEAGQNAELLKEVLASLEPNAPVYGWEQGVSEDVFVRQVTRYGHMMVPYDWAWNTSLTSYDFKSRQKSTLAKVKNPQFIDFDSPEKKYVSFYLSDGDNVQWMMNSFEAPQYYGNPDAKETKMAYGFPFANLPMIAPAQFDRLLSMQGDDNTLIENLGGGYYYVDEFASETFDRRGALRKIAKDMASHMRQHRVKILGVVAIDIDSDAAMEAYREYIRANDELEAIVAIQYDPYAGGEGEIMWFENSKGYRIPVITVKYAIWNHGGRNLKQQGTPAYVASKINDESLDNPFSVVSVHCWSNFTDIGESNDLLAENEAGGNIVGASAAKLSMNRFDEDVKVVSLHELVWRIRMYYEPEQTEEYLSKVF